MKMNRVQHIKVNKIFLVTSGHEYVCRYTFKATSREGASFAGEFVADLGLRDVVR